MRAPPWKSLIVDLSKEGFQSEYLDRLKRRVDIELATEELEKEIVREIASALGRAGVKVDYAFLRLEVLEQKIETASGERRRRWIKEWNLLREEAILARHELRVHREAIGIRRNGALERLYPVPPRRHYV